jgi:hypothetical protein
MRRAEPSKDSAVSACAHALDQHITHRLSRPPRYSLFEALVGERFAAARSQIFEPFVCSAQMRYKRRNCGKWTKMLFAT